MCWDCRPLKLTLNEFLWHAGKVDRDGAMYKEGSHNVQIQILIPLFAIWDLTKANFSLPFLTFLNCVAWNQHSSTYFIGLHRAVFSIKLIKTLYSVWNIVISQNAARLEFPSKQLGLIQKSCCSAFKPHPCCTFAQLLPNPLINTIEHSRASLDTCQQIPWRCGTLVQAGWVGSGYTMCSKLWTEGMLLCYRVTTGFRQCSSLNSRGLKLTDLKTNSGCIYHCSFRQAT